MPMYDRQCKNGHTQIDLWEAIDTPDPACPECGETSHRACWLAPTAVVGDDVIIDIKHGLCNPDGSPRRYYSKTEIREEAKRRGMTWGADRNEHVTEHGTDKARHTTRWT